MVQCVCCGIECYEDELDEFGHCDGCDGDCLDENGEDDH